jgi:hypothetical protein
VLSVMEQKLDKLAPLPLLFLLCKMGEGPPLLLGHQGVGAEAVRWHDSGLLRRRVGRQHAVVAVTMPARRRYQGRQAVDQFEWRQQHADTAARARLDALVEPVLGIDLP